MIKKVLATAVTVGLLAGQTAVATAAPALERDASPVAGAEEMGFGVSTPILVALFLLIGAGIIYAVDQGDDQDLPSSP